MKFKEGQRFVYVAGGYYKYYCKVLSVNEFGSPYCSITPIEVKSRKENRYYERVLKKSSFTNGERTIVDENIRDRPLTKEEEYDNLWI